MKKETIKEVIQKITDWETKSDIIEVLEELLEEINQ